MRLQFDQTKRKIERLDPKEYLKTLDGKFLVVNLYLGSISGALSTFYSLVLRTLTSASPITEERLKILSPYLEIIFGYEMDLDDLDLYVRKFVKKGREEDKLFINSLEYVFEKSTDALKENLLEICLLLSYAEGRPSYKTRFWLQNIFDGK